MLVYADCGRQLTGLTFRTVQATYIVGEDLFQGRLEVNPWEDLESLVNVPGLGVRVVHNVSVELLPLSLVLLERCRLEALEVAADPVLLLGRVTSRHQALQQIDDIDRSEEALLSCLVIET